MILKEMGDSTYTTYGLVRARAPDSKRRRGVLIALLAAIVLLPIASWFIPHGDAGAGADGPEPTPADSVAERRRARQSEPISPIAARTEQDVDVVTLGEKLFHDARLSLDGSVSCATCHRIQTGGGDGLPVSRGVGGVQSDYNAPTVLNAATNFRQFWDGRAKTLEQQVEASLLNPKEMGTTWDHVLSVLKSDEQYRGQFEKTPAGEISAQSVTRAVAEYERFLQTPGARFDRWLLGDDDAVNREEQLGYQLFKEYRCTSCHQGENVGGGIYRRLGTMRDYFQRHRSLRKSDLGRFNITGDAHDLYAFKVPSLRNVELTAPYFHDGSAVTLEDAVGVMVKYQLDRPIVEHDIRLIAMFLRTLTGELKPAGQDSRPTAGD